MKTLLLLSILALPLAAQTPDAKHLEIPRCSGGDPAPLCPAESADAVPTPLTSDEVVPLAVAYIEFQQSQIQWLQKWETDQAGKTASGAIDQATQKYQALLKPLVAKYYPSCPTAYWDFTNHTWFCPPPPK